MRKTIFSFRSFIALCFVLTLYTLSRAQVYVDIDAGGTNDGSSWTDAYIDLQAAIDAIGSGEIWVAEGTYLPDVSDTGDRDLSFSMKNGVAIYGGFDGAETMLSERDLATHITIMSGDIGTASDNTDNSYHVVDNSTNSLDATAILDGFTISDGNADGMSTLFQNIGAGMYNNLSSPTISNCIFSNNTAQSAAGMANLGSNTFLTNCTFTNNTATGNGGGLGNNNCTPTLNNCTFSDNTAGINGGGIFNFFNSNSIISDCTFSNNSANRGGGINNDSSNPTLTDCTFSNNSASTGGGMYNNSSSPSLANCSFSNNAVTSTGGGIYSRSSSSPTLTNCSFSNNSADDEGGGMCNNNSSPTLTTCTFNNNSANQGGGIYNNSSSPLGGGC